MTTGTFNIRDYGAQEGMMNTTQIQAAFDAADKEQGTVIIPAGTYKSGTINMKNASLYLEKGACLLGSGKIEDYKENGFIHNEMGGVLSLLYSMNSTGVHISGEGLIDLNGDAFYIKGDWDVPASKVPFTQAQKEECTLKKGKRPNQPLFFYNCEHMCVKDIRIIGAPSWTMAFIECKDVRVTDLTIDNSLSVPNSDGMHFCSCDGVQVRGCNVSAGDDCIAVTAATNWEKPCERVTISDCIFRSCSKAISLGYMHSIVRDVVVSNCVVYESNRALVVMSCAGTGLVENITVSNLRLDTRIRAGNWWGNGEPVCIMGTYHNNEHYSEKVPERNFPVNVRNMLFQNLICSGENVMAVIGKAGSVENIRFENVSFELKDSANMPLKGRCVDLAPGEQTAIMPDNEVPYWLFLKEVKNVSVRNAFVHKYKGVQPEALIENCEEAFA